MDIPLKALRGSNLRVEDPGTRLGCPQQHPTSLWRYLSLPIVRRTQSYGVYHVQTDTPRTSLRTLALGHRHLLPEDRDQHLRRDVKKDGRRLDSFGLGRRFCKSHLQIRGCNSGQLTAQAFCD